MAGPRIATAKDALKTFLRSLPVGCSFSLVSFGTNMQVLNQLLPHVGPVFKYNEETTAAAIKKINTFSADLGGTDILTPLEIALE